MTEDTADARPGPAADPDPAEPPSQPVPLKVRADAHPIQRALADFLNAMDDYRDAMSTGLPELQKAIRLRYNAALEKAKYCQTVFATTPDTATLIAANPHDTRDMVELSRELDRLKGQNVVATAMKSFFIGMFSDFDSFLGALLKALYEVKPELLSGIKREIALSDLIQYEDLSAVKVDLLDKEIDSFRRESYIDQFRQLEERFKIQLREFPEWPTFVEMSQRRNLFTHNGGRVSQQYLVLCRQEKYTFNPEPALREQIKLDGAYLVRVMFLLIKLAFMLSQTLWRKVLPDQFAVAGEAVNRTIYGLLLGRRWRLASELGSFGLQEVQMRGVDEIARRIRIVNVAIALKQLKKDKEVAALLASHDWTACIREFQLAIAILEDDYEKASELMLSIGKAGELISQLGYHDWPLFTDFRDRQEFQVAYERIYGVPFLKGTADTIASQAKEVSAVPPDSESAKEQIGKPSEPGDASARH